MAKKRVVPSSPKGYRPFSRPGERRLTPAAPPLSASSMAPAYIPYTPCTPAGALPAGAAPFTPTGCFAPSTPSAGMAPCTPGGVIPASAAPGTPIGIGRIVQSTPSAGIVPCTPAGRLSASAAPRTPTAALNAPLTPGFAVPGTPNGAFGSAAPGTPIAVLNALSSGFAVPGTPNGAFGFAAPGTPIAALNAPFTPGFAVPGTPNGAFGFAAPGTPIAALNALLTSGFAVPGTPNGALGALGSAPGPQVPQISMASTGVPSTPAPLTTASGTPSWVTADMLVAGGSTPPEWGASMCLGASAVTPPRRRHAGAGRHRPRSSRIHSRSRTRSRSRECRFSRSPDFCHATAKAAQLREKEEAKLQAAISASGADEATVHILVDMGISPVLAREALRATMNDANAAADRILSRNMFEANGTFLNAHSKLREVEAKLEATEPRGDFILGISASHAQLRELEEVIRDVSVSLDSIDIACDLLLRGAQKFSLDDCSRLRRRVMALIAAVDEIDDVAAPDQGTTLQAAESVAGLTREPASSKRCFVPATLFKTPTGLFVRADDVAIGVKITSRGHDVEIVSAIQHPPQQEQIVELVTATTKLKVTGAHRIVVPHNDGEDEVLARHVQASSLIICENMPQKVLEVRHSVEEVSVVELQFENDAPIETYPPLQAGVVTKGQASVDALPFLQKCKIEESDEVSTTASGSTGVHHMDENASSVGSRAPRSGRCRARRARARASIQRLPSPGNEYS